MSKAVIKRSLINMRKFYAIRAKYVIKNDPLMKEYLKDFEDHFKKYKWPLDYMFYFDASKLRNDAVFNFILEAKGYDIRYSKKNLAIMIYKSKK